MSISNSKNTNDGDITAGTSVNIGDQIFTSGHNVPPILSALGASVSEDFLGRDEDLSEIRKRIIRGQHLVLLQGEGGIGKTSLAAKYWQTYLSEYKHAAWIFCDKGILNAIRETMTVRLGLEDDIKQFAVPAQQYAAIKTAMSNLDGNCLLVLDNADNEHHLQEFQDHFSGLNWHIIITLRSLKVFSPDNVFHINHLPENLAKELFKKYYNEDTSKFDELLERFLKAIGYNTLCIEIFAKNLRELRAMGKRFEGFLTSFESKGMYLQEDSFEVHTNYLQKKKATTDEFLDLLYDFSQLNEAENVLLTMLALLPSENHTLVFLLQLFAPEHPQEFKRNLDRLAKKGWLFTDTISYRVSPVIQNILLSKNADILWTLGEKLVNKIADELKDTIESELTKRLYEAVPFARIANSISLNLGVENERIIHLFDELWEFYDQTGDLSQSLFCAERMHEISENIANKHAIFISYLKLGDTHIAMGNLEKALSFFEEGMRIAKELAATDADNTIFKNDLTVSYSRLGDTHEALGNLEKALFFFEEDMRIIKELAEAYEDNVSFKNGLAISYSKLGATHKFLGNLEKALSFFDDYFRVRKELAEAYKDNVNFKHGLAVSYSKLGEIHKALGNLEKALSFFEDYFRITKELAETYKDNVSFKNGLAISCSKLGDTYTALGNLEKALSFFEDYFRLTKELIETYGDNASFKHGLSISYSRLGDTHKALGNQEKALSFFEEDMRIAKELADTYKDNVSFKNGLAISYLKFGGIHTALGQREAALTYLQNAEKIWEELTIAFPLYVEFKQNLEWVKNHLDKM